MWIGARYATPRCYGAAQLEEAVLLLADYSQEPSIASEMLGLNRIGRFRSSFLHWTAGAWTLDPICQLVVELGSLQAGCGSVVVPDGLIVRVLEGVCCK